MRSGFFAACLLGLLQSALWGQGAIAPTIVTQPVGLQALIGDPATLSAAANGTAPLAYQWQKDGVSVAGATNSTLFFLSLALTDGGTYTLVASNGAGTATSLPAYVAVGKRPQSISFAASSGAIAAGSGVVLGATASSSLPVAYALVSGAARLSSNVLTGNGGAVTVRATQAGNDTFLAADPVERTFNFVAGALSPFIANPPVDQTVDAGVSATFHASALGTPAPTYQWQKDGLALPGATTSSLTVVHATPADGGRYTITATNLVGTSTASATLTVRTAPVFITLPASVSAAAGDAVTFSVATTGFPTPTYQWRKNGAAIAGATGATLTLRSAATSDAGRFDVVATNALGSVTSPIATLTVTARDFTGVYFGRFAPATATGTGGELALFVRPNRTAALLAYDGGIPGVLVVTNLPIDLSGTFSRSVAVGPRNVTVRGTLNDTNGELTGTIPELNRTFSGQRAERTGVAAAQTGFYQLALVGSASDRGYVILAPDGRALLLSANATAAEGATGTLATNGRLAITTASRATVDLGFNNGQVSGTVRPASGAAGALLGVIDTRAGTEHVVNLSVRASTSNATPLIMGFVVRGTGSKQVLLRAAGPTLGQAPFNLAGVLADPTLQVFRGNNSIAQNDEWGTPAANRTLVTNAGRAAGAFPFRTGSTDAALVTTLAAGAYTVQIGGGNGLTLAEVYEVLANNETAGSRRLVNVSARGLVSPGAPVIAGLVVTGPAPQRVLIRAVGPTLGQPPFNVPGTLANPQLTLLRGSAVVKSNDDWFRDPEAALIRDAAARAGAFPLPGQSADAAMLLYLAPGNYTAQISGPANANQQNGTGIALIEVYESAP